MARSRTKSMKRSKIRKSGVKKYSRCKQRYRRKKTRAKGKPKKQQEGGMNLMRRLRRKEEPDPSPMANIAVEYFEEDFIVRFRYKGKEYSITGPELIEFCKLADAEAKPEALPDYGEKRDYNDYLASFKEMQEAFKIKVKPEIIQELKQVPSLIKEKIQGSVEEMDIMLGRLFWVIFSEMDEATINIFLKGYAEELFPNQ